MSGMPLFIDAETVHRLFEWTSLIDYLATFHQQPMPAVERLLMEQPAAHEGRDGLLLWPAWLPGQALGVKLVTSMPGNPACGLPTVHAVYVLFEGKHGRPTHVIDATAMTLWKTAADSALGARFLARADCRTLAVLGAGALAPWLVRAHRAVRPGIERVLIWNRTREKAVALAASLGDLGIQAEVVATPQDAACAADLVTCATASRTPILAGRWLRPGTHIDLVGSFTPEMRESDDDVVRRAAIFVDSRAFTVRVCGDLLIPLQSGVICEEQICGDLFDLCSGRVRGRTDADAITLFKNGGGGHLDLATALYLRERLAA